MKTRALETLGIVTVLALAALACEDKKETAPVTVDAGMPAAASAAALASDDAIPVASDFEAEAESVTAENVEAEIAKLEAQLAASD